MHGHSLSQCSQSFFTSYSLFMSNHTTLGDPHQGLAFHELILLPTLAPELTHPYYVPGTPEFLAVQATLQQAAATSSTGETGRSNIYSISLIFIIVPFRSAFRDYVRVYF
jgi:hypothetical protein